MVNSLKELAVVSGNNGLMDIAKGAVDAATAVANITANFGGLVPALTLVLGLIVAFKREKIASNVVSMGDSIVSLGKDLHNLKNMIIGTKNEAINLNGAVVTSSRTFKASSVSLQSFIGYVGIAIGVIGMFTAAVKANEQAELERQQAHTDAANSAFEYQNELNSLIKKYQELTELKEKTPQVEMEIQNTIKSITDLVKEHSGIEQDKLKILQSQTSEYKDQLQLLKEISHEEYKKIKISILSNFQMKKSNSKKVKLR